MNKDKIIEILSSYNDSRRGGGDMPNPKEVGEAIDCAIDLLKSQVCGKMELPDEAEAVRHRVKLHGDNLYISVVLVDEEPVEVFASIPPAWRHNEERRSYLESLNRQVSISLRYGIPVEEVVRQFAKGSADGQYPALLAEVLSGYLTPGIS